MNKRILLKIYTNFSITKYSAYQFWHISLENNAFVFLELLTFCDTFNRALQFSEETGTQHSPHRVEYQQTSLTTNTAEKIFKMLTFQLFQKIKDL